MVCSFELCRDEGEPLSDRQKTAILTAAFLEFDGIEHELDSTLALEQLLALPAAGAARDRWRAGATPGLDLHPRPLARARIRSQACRRRSGPAPAATRGRYALPPRVPEGPPGRIPHRRPPPSGRPSRPRSVSRTMTCFAAPACCATFASSWRAALRSSRSWRTPCADSDRRSRGSRRAGRRAGRRREAPQASPASSRTNGMELDDRLPKIRDGLRDRGVGSREGRMRRRLGRLLQLVARREQVLDRVVVQRLGERLTLALLGCQRVRPSVAAVPRRARSTRWVRRSSTAERRTAARPIQAR